MHVAKLRVCRHRATSSTHGNEGAVTAVILVSAQALESFRRLWGRVDTADALIAELREHAAVAGAQSA